MREEPTDKITHGYGDFYRGLLSVYPDRLRLLEIGAAYGAGLRWFKELAPHATVIGVELDNDRADDVERQGFTLYRGNATHPGLPTWLAFGQELETTRGGLLDVVVDDGSHIPGEIAQAFQSLWPWLADGGTYVVEDFNHVSAVDVSTILIWAEIGRRPDVAQTLALDQGIIAFRKTG
jgi:hypothetical protein